MIARLSVPLGGGELCAGIRGASFAGEVFPRPGKRARTRFGAREAAKLQKRTENTFAAQEEVFGA